VKTLKLSYEAVRDFLFGFCFSGQVKFIIKHDQRPESNFKDLINHSKLVKSGFGRQ
jgi:hypothetical protein